MKLLPIIPSLLERRKKFIVFCVIAITSLVVAYFAFAGASMDSATDDEPAHIAAGYLQLSLGVFNFYREQPPLMNAINALPIWLSDSYHFPADWGHIGNKWAVGKKFLYHSGNDPDSILLMARLPEIALFILLCLLVYVWIFEITGSHYYGLLGFFLAITCPNLLAHGRLATSDIGLTFFIFLASFFYLRFLDKPVMFNVFMTGVATGCALLSKISGLILLPYFGILLVFFLIFKKKFHSRAVVFYISRFLLIAVFALLFMEGFYFLEMRSVYLHYAYPRMADSLTSRFLVPFHEYAGNIGAVYRWVSKPYDKLEFLLGKFSYSGWWYYYIVAFILKTRIPALLFFLWALGGMVFLCARRVDTGRTTHRNFHFLSLAVFMALFFLTTLRSKVDIGVRYILPIYPFLFVFIPVSLFQIYSLTKKKTAKVAVAAIVILAIWSAAISVISYPSYLGYFNSFIGPERNADQYLIDSNLDWGQDLKRLALWVKQHDISKIHVIYFGGGDPAYYLGSRVIAGTAMQSMRYFLAGRPGYYAISRQDYRLFTALLNKGKDFDLSSLPISLSTCIGTSIYVFRVQ